MGHFRLNILYSRGGGIFGGFGRGIVEIRGAIELGKDREFENRSRTKWLTYRRSSGRGIVLGPRGLPRAGLGGNGLKDRSAVRECWVCNCVSS